MSKVIGIFFCLKFLLLSIILHTLYNTTLDILVIYGNEYRTPLDHVFYFLQHVSDHYFEHYKFCMTYDLCSAVCTH